jgi:uncharacterized membrane protein
VGRRLGTVAPPRTHYDHRGGVVPCSVMNRRARQFPAVNLGRGLLVMMVMVVVVVVVVVVIMIIAPVSPVLGGSQSRLRANL